MNQPAVTLNKTIHIRTRPPPKEAVTQTIPTLGQNVPLTQRPLNGAVKPDPAATITPPTVHRPPAHVLVIIATAPPHLAVCHMDPHTDTTRIVSK